MISAFASAASANWSAPQIANCHRSDDPLDLSEFYDIQANRANDLASLNPRQRADIYAFYGHLAQINSYLLQRQALNLQEESLVKEARARAGGVASFGEAG